MKNYLWESDIQLSDGSRGKKNAELLDLYKKAAAMKKIKLTLSAMGFYIEGLPIMFKLRLQSLFSFSSYGGKKLMSALCLSLSFRHLIFI